jgi:DtxR family Mn-dependent transcriptional regulator
MLTKSEENYIKEIYTLEQECNSEVNTNLIAEKVATKASSVTDMLKKLDKKKLLIYQKYKGVKLNVRGKKIALSVIRKHRLWETFLVDKLNFTWDEVHDIAEQLEHIESDKLIDRLDAFLNFPETDPHGDPIPNKKGKFKKTGTVCLSELKIEEEGVFIEVKNDSEDFLKFLNKKNITIGSSIKIIDKEDFDNSVKIEINKDQFFISENVVKNLYLKR